MSPYPTPTRLRLADAIAAGQVKHYHWVNGWSCDTVRDANVTARVDELVKAGLAEIPPRADLPESIVRLTADGMAWVTRARTREPVSEEAMDAALVAVFNDLAENGPVSTSPETGPRPACDDPNPILGRRSQACPAHGVHPHNGMTCLDCAVCRPAESTKDGT